MASNPIQRRARQSFLIGFLLALIIMAIIVVLLFAKISSLKAEVVKQTVQYMTFYTAKSTIKSGELITPDMLQATQVRCDTDMSNYLTDAYFVDVDEEENKVEWKAKIDIDAGSLLTEKMVVQVGKELTDDERIVEYNMISLPSQLSNHDYIDVRISFPNGESYIVLSKKYIEATTATSVWMRMSELDIMSLSSAIVETAQIQGTRLYATTYIEPGLQNEAEPTYAANEAVLDAINKDPNVLTEAMNALAERWNRVTGSGSSDLTVQRNNINGYLSGKTQEEKSSAVAGANSTEDNAIKAARDEYVSALEGTGLIGTDSY